MIILMRYLFAFIILVHGLIHFQGFAKAFGYTQHTKITAVISKRAGACWLIASCCFIAVLVAYLLGSDTWWMFALLAVIISQVLIFVDWKDAKFGTGLNLFILIVSITSFADWSFNRMVKKEVARFFSVPAPHAKIITNEMMTQLPAIVQKWLNRSGIVGKPNVYQLRLKQRGVMRLKPQSRWMKFNATEYFVVNDPAYNWQVNVNVMPLIYMSGRDKYTNGDGEVLIKLFSVKSIVDAKASYERNQGTLVRYLSEICWFPSAALSPYIKWEAMNDNSARAIMTYNDIHVSGVFYFTKEGDIQAFETMRFGDFDGGTSLEKWHIESKSFKSFDGIRIPSSSEVTWKLEAGDFTWLKLELEKVEYNKPGFFEDD